MPPAKHPETIPLNRYLKHIKRLYNKRNVAYASMYWLLAQAVPYRKQLLIKLGINSISLFMGFVSTIAGKYIVDATTSGNLSWFYISYMAGASLCTILFAAVSNIFSAYLNEKFEFGMRCDIFDQIQRSIWSDLSRYHSGDIVTRLTSDIANISSGLISIIPASITLGIRLVVSFFILLYFDPWIALFALIIAPIGSISALLYRRKYRYYQTRLRESESTYRTFMQENLSNLSVTKSFQLENANNKYLRQIRSDRMVLVMKSAHISAFMSSVISIIYRAGYVVAFCWSAYRISQGQITYGTMTIFLSLVSQVQSSISSLGFIIPQIYSMLVSSKRLTDIADIKNEEYSEAAYSPTKVTVQMHDVSFAYDKSNVLEHVSLQVDPGDIVGIVGPSGVGKTTLTRLLLSLVKPDIGSVEYISERGDCEEACPASRRFISYVPQGNTLISGTIETNLRIGKKDATEEELWAALRMAAADKFIQKTENGLQTQLSEKAGGLSEGQAQRIAIARALLRNKPLLILDEATSALDEDTEALILKSITKSYGKTIIIITHRKSMLRYCNKIVEISEDATVNMRSHT